MAEIFIVDDEVSICESLDWMLKKEGYSVSYAMDYDTAVQIIKKRDFDIFLIDLVLPSGGGIELIKLIKELKRKGIVIIITGYPNIPTLVDSVRLDTYDYVKKPISVVELKKIIEMALAQYQN